MIIVVDQDYIGHVVHFPSRTAGAGAIGTQTNVDGGGGVRAAARCHPMRT